jgi:hypothetical protein
MVGLLFQEEATDTETNSTIIHLCDKAHIAMVGLLFQEEATDTETNSTIIHL